MSCNVIQFVCLYQSSAFDKGIKINAKNTIRFFVPVTHSLPFVSSVVQCAKMEEHVQVIVI